MPIINGMNDDYISYFPLEEYVKKIKLDPKVQDHHEETINLFNEYLDKLSKYDKDYVISYWIDMLYEEFVSSHEIENMDYNKINLNDDEIFFDNLRISKQRIHELHNFAVDGQYEPTFEFRKRPVNVSRYNPDGSEDIFWRGANAEDVDKFMTDFIKIYKHRDLSTITNSPFLKSSLMHLLFLRIHPYMDGNGRTARLIHNAKFTECINRQCGTNLRISPLNLSHSILLYKKQYADTINQIYFDLEHDNNDAINEWFNFMLNRVDDQINYSMYQLDFLDPSLARECQPDTLVRKMKVEKLLNK